MRNKVLPPFLICCIDTKESQSIKSVDHIVIGNCQVTVKMWALEDFPILFINNVESLLSK